MNFKQRVLRYEFQLNDTDDRIVDYINEHRKEILSLSIQKAAADLYISPNSVMRLSKKLGYSGFSELKYAINGEDKPIDKDKTLVKQMMEQLPENIVRTLDTIEESTIRRASDMLKHAHCCILAGVGDSYPFCEMMKNNLRCFGKNVQCDVQIHDMMYSVEHGKPEDIVVIISARGENERLLSIGKKAKKKGMQLISITHLEMNPLAEMADLRLHFYGPYRLVNGYNVTDRCGLIILLRLLSEEFWNTYYEINEK